MKASPAPLVRPLHEGDAPAFRALRLRALEEDPAPFMTTYEEDEARPISEVAARLASSSTGTGVLGAFRGDALIGSVGFSRHAAAKARHRVLLWGMYVAPEERRHSVGRAMLLQVVALLRAVEDVEQIELTVVSREQAARSLYLAVGFERQGTVRHAVKVGGEYLDEDTLVLWLPRGSTGPSHPLPAGLPAPVDDGAAGKLPGAQLPDGLLSSSVGGGLRLASMLGRTVVYVYPRTAGAHEAITESWNAIPGARGCTSEACAFRDHAADVASAGARLVGLSAQSTDDQIE
ncbi:MAG TPA: GNAT family N-acetyltransferase, partial [Polyangiaceae bacterium]